MTGTPLPDSRPVGVAVVGFGNAGRQHVAAITGLADARLVAVVETGPEAYRRATDAGLPVRSLPDVLADPSVGLVAVCLPPGARPDVTAGVLAAGKHLLVEKLPARTGAELDELSRAAARAGVSAGVMFQHRFALPEPLRHGGPRRFAGAAATLLVSRPRSATHFRAGDWRSDPSTAGGGVTAHLGVHYLDLACQLLGEPESATPLVRVDAVPGIDAELYGHVRFRNSANLVVAVTSRVAARHEHLVVLGERDRVELRAGAVSGELDGTALHSPARPAADLRIEVYREMAAALRGGPAVDVAALSRSVGVTAVLDGLLAPEGGGAVRDTAAAGAGART